MTEQPNPLNDLREQAALLLAGWRALMVSPRDVRAWADAWLARADVPIDHLGPLADISVPGQVHAHSIADELVELAGRSEIDPLALIGLAAALYRVGRWSIDSVACALYYLEQDYQPLYPADLASLWDELDLARDGYGDFAAAQGRLESIMDEYAPLCSWFEPS